MYYLFIQTENGYKFGAKFAKLKEMQPAQAVQGHLKILKPLGTIFCFVLTHWFELCGIHRLKINHVDYAQRQLLSSFPLPNEAFSNEAF